MALELPPVQWGPGLNPGCMYGKAGVEQDEPSCWPLESLLLHKLLLKKLFVMLYMETTILYSL